VWTGYTAPGKLYLVGVKPTRGSFLRLDSGGCSALMILDVGVDCQPDVRRPGRVLVAHIIKDFQFPDR
jgi:hypothetical protein